MTGSKYGVVIAARSDSRRLPGKALLPLRGVPMLAYLIRRLRGSRLAGHLILATTERALDDELEELARAEGIEVFRGSTTDVVARFVSAARAFPAEFVVRVTADCPFVDAATLDHCLAQCDLPRRFDLASTKTRFPVGIDFEIYRVRAMEELAATDLDMDEREHLTLGMYRRPDRFSELPLLPPAGWPKSSRSFTVDTEADYAAARAWAEELSSPLSSVAELLSIAP